MEDVVDITQIFRFLLVAFIIGIAVIRTKTSRKTAPSAPPLPQNRKRKRIPRNKPHKPEPQASMASPEPATKEAPRHPQSPTPAPKETGQPAVVDTGNIEEVRKGIIWSVILQRRF